MKKLMLASLAVFVGATEMEGMFIINGGESANSTAQLDKITQSRKVVESVEIVQTKRTRKKKIGLSTNGTDSKTTNLAQTSLQNSSCVQLKVDDSVQVKRTRKRKVADLSTDVVDNKSDNLTRTAVQSNSAQSKANDSVQVKRIRKKSDATDVD